MGGANVTLRVPSFYALDKVFRQYYPDHYRSPNKGQEETKQESPNDPVQE